MNIPMKPQPTRTRNGFLKPPEYRLKDHEAQSGCIGVLRYIPNLRAQTLLYGSSSYTSVALCKNTDKASGAFLHSMTHEPEP